MSKKSWLGVAVLSVVLAWLPSCGSVKACQGAEKCECYPNDTCDAGLACRSNTCVSLTPTASGGASSTSGGAGNSGNPSGGATSMTDGGGNHAGAGSSSAGTANSGGAGGAGRAGAPGHAGSSGGGNKTDSKLGISCTSNLQCGSGMLCATPSGTWFGEGGPSHGMCTKACAIGGSECDALKPGAACFDFGTGSLSQAYCLDACEQGAPADLNAKCAGRSDFVCADLSSTGTPLTFCVPHCRSDAECGSGLYCDQSSILGVCTKIKRTGDPVDSPCTPDAATDTCEGRCLRTSANGVTPASGVCTELCSAGTECMYGPGTNPVPGGFCGGALSSGTFGPIDLGYCLSNCSCSSDCHGPDNLCRKWPAEDADIASALGAPGICYPVLVGSVELSCAQGGTGGAGAGAGGTPAQTAGAGGSH